VSDIVIEKGVPLPSIRAFTVKLKATLWQQMDVGDSVYFPFSRSKAAYVSAKTFEYKNKKRGWLCTSRKDANGIRIWRTA
jgi:hypothetical protein